jgi:hypothetical protein
MPSLAAQMMQRFRYGKPIVVVSGLPRSGTSLAMSMLEAGGVPILTDGIRTADISNPKGYYEFERVKGLDKGDSAWLTDARGKAVKIISFLLTWLPETHHYQVIFMRRDLDEAVASQEEMLRRRNEPSDAGKSREIRNAYEEHLTRVMRFLASRSCFSTLTVDYGDVVARPRDAASRIAGFLEEPLDLERMTTVADPRLYRNRRQVEA